MLNQEQLQAVKHLSGPLLVIAGAGSGKTRIVTQRIAYLIEQGIDPSCILGLTFTNKAAQEMKDRVRAICHQNVLISTFHSLGVRILRSSIGALGYSTNFTIYDEEDSLKVLKSCLDFMGLKDKEFSPKVFKNLISNAKNQLLPPDETFSGSSLVEQWFPKVYKMYLEKLKDYGALDFDDLLYLTVILFQKHKDILDHYQERFKFLLVDEYQDTNSAQYQLVELLSRKNHNLFVVGDPDQSIYSWRGANIRNILDFKKDYPEAKIVRLEQNYRSTSTILSAANALIANNQNRLEKNLWSALGQGPRIYQFTAENERSEAEFVVMQMLEQKEKNNIPFSQMVVFYRTNFQSRAFEDALLRKRIAYTIVGGISFYQRKEIKDILAFLRLVHSPSDFVSFSRTINLPKRGFGEATIENMRLFAEKNNLPILKALEVALVSGVKMNAKQKESLNEYLTFFKEINLFQGPLEELVAQVIRKSRYLEYLKEDKETYDERKENLDELLAKAAEWQLINEEASLTSFLEELSLKSTLDEASQNDDKIHLMTVHNGKGLEYTVTFLVGLEEDLFPHANSRGSFDALEEERRLCYVGMTRAKKYLYLTHAEVRYLFGTCRYMRRSRFLSEIPPQYIHKLRSAYYLPDD
jgi:DNA helicase-2/ATP-dependent DNA helicase PcrA